MAHMLVHHKVEDYNKFKPVFDMHTTARSEAGAKGGRVFCNVNNPNEVFVLLEWDNLENAQKFAQSNTIKEAMKNAGVIGMPEIYFVEEAAVNS